jgi:hypothetical protein
MKKSADWFAWLLHGLYGLFVGLVTGLALTVRRGMGFWLRAEFMIPFLVGVALIGDGLGSRYGDRLWMGDNYYMLPPDEPAQSNLSDWISWSLVASGTATCIVTILKHFGVL